LDEIARECELRDRNRHLEGVFKDPHACANCRKWAEYHDARLQKLLRIQELLELYIILLK
jgi:hypothetical protein